MDGSETSPQHSTTPKSCSNSTIMGNTESGRNTIVFIPTFLLQWKAKTTFESGTKIRKGQRLICNGLLLDCIIEFGANEWFKNWDVHSPINKKCWKLDWIPRELEFLWIFMYFSLQSVHMRRCKSRNSNAILECAMLSDPSIYINIFL